MTEDQLIDLRQRQAKYIASLRASGATIVTYRKPCCGQQSEARAQPPGEPRQWDTLSTCEHCGAMYMKSTRGEEVIATIPEELKNGPDT